MKIIIFGPPGSGKGTQSDLIIKKYGISKISTGDILRNFIEKERSGTILFKKNIKNGILINDDIIIDLIIKKIKKNRIRHFILDGFPRTIKQAQALDKSNIIINYIIELTLNRKIIYERILGRRIHIKSGRTYHIKYNPPKIPELDDITHEKLITRTDDNIDTINTRLIEYHKMRDVILNHYTNQINNNIIKYIKIDGEKKINKIFYKIENFMKRDI